MQSKTVHTAVGELPEIPGGWTLREMTVASHRFRLTLPDAPDDFLDDPRVHAAHRHDGFMPYWPYLWPAARTMAQAMLTTSWPSGRPTLEIGCGTGLVGLAALAGGMRVTFSDYDPTAVMLAVHNARQNGFAAEGLCIDWRQPPPRQVPLIFGCDVIYEISDHPAVLNLLQTMLTPDGICWIGDPGRRTAGRFVDLARRRGFGVQLQNETGRRLSKGQTGRFHIIVLRRV